MHFKKNTGALVLTFPLTSIPPPVSNSALVSPQVGALYPGTEALADQIPTGDLLADAMAEVDNVIDLIAQKKWPTTFLETHHPRIGFDGSRIPAPLQLAGIRKITDFAIRLVQNDHHTDLGKICERWLHSVGALPKNATGHIDFVEETTRFARLAQRTSDALVAAFKAKYYHGHVNPEEYKGLSGAIYTSYINGCPAHPECPSGHAAVSGATAAHIKHEWNLTPSQIEEIDDTVFHFMSYRTFAGVHIAFSNRYGAEIGRMVAEASF
jgi:hypothetical protein